jgi:hypothetical protein
MTITRTFSCLNRNCQTEFDSSEDYPPCPRCGGLRCKWLPKPVAINSGATAAIDLTARQLAEDHGLTNFNTPQLGRPAVNLPAMNGETAGSFEPMPGWKINLPAAALSGGGTSVCMPTGVTAKIKVDPNAGPLKESDGRTGMAALREATRFEGRTRGGGQ